MTLPDPMHDGPGNPHVPGERPNAPGCASIARPCLQCGVEDPLFQLGRQDLRPAFPFGGSSQKVGAFCLCAKGQRLAKEKINIIFSFAKPAWSSPNLNEMQEQSSRLGTTGAAPQGSLTLPSVRSDCFLPATIDIVTEVKARYDESCSRLILTSATT